MRRPPNRAETRCRRDRPIQALTWDYLGPDENDHWRIKDEPSALRVLKEINGTFTADGMPIRSAGDLKADGTTACGAWIYSGVFAPTSESPQGHNHAANRVGDNWVASGWGFAWPANRRILYNRASADPAGRPWAKEGRLARKLGDGRADGYVFWDERARKWSGMDVPDFPLEKAPDRLSDPNGLGMAFHDGASPFILKADGKGWLFVPVGLVDGPLPTHYEPFESPVINSLYPERQVNPVTKLYRVAGNDYAAPGSPEWPCVLSTYRLTEHHLSGSMSRWLPWLSSLQPELFVEISPEHSSELNASNLEWVSISTPRGTIHAKALVTPRVRPFLIDGRTIHHVGMPWHWGYKGVVTGDVVNDLTALVGDPNVTIHEAKVFVCRVEKRGPVQESLVRS